MLLLITIYGEKIKADLHDDRYSLLPMRYRENVGEDMNRSTNKLVRFKGKDTDSYNK